MDLQLSGLATPNFVDKIAVSKAGRNVGYAYTTHDVPARAKKNSNQPTLTAIQLYVNENLPAAVMAPIRDRPEDSTAEESYQIGEKVYYLKAGKIASLLYPRTAENAGLIEEWRKGEVKDLDSESSSNPIYHIKDEEYHTTHKRASDRLAKRTGS